MLPNGKTGESLWQGNRKKPPYTDFPGVERVKRGGKSSPVPVATPEAVPLMGCKAKYITIYRVTGKQGCPSCFQQ